MGRFEPTMSELAERERALRESILGGAVIKMAPAQESFSASARPTPTPQEPRGLIAPGVPASVLEEVDVQDVIPQAAHLISIDFDSGKVVTSFGSFDLAPLEIAGAANLGIQALMRNLNAVLAHLKDLHGVTAAEQAFAMLEQHERQVAVNEEANAAIDAAAKLVVPQITPAVARGRRVRKAATPPPIQSAAVKPTIVISDSFEGEEELKRPLNTFDKEADSRQRPYRPK